MTDGLTAFPNIPQLAGPVHHLPRKLAWVVSVVTVAGMLDDTRSLLTDLLSGGSIYLASIRLAILLGLGGTGLAFAFRPKWAPVSFAILIAVAAWKPHVTNLHLVMLLLLVCAAMLLDWLRLASMALPYLALRMSVPSAATSFWDAILGIVMGIALGRVVWMVVTHKEKSEHESRELMRAAQERAEAAALQAAVMEQRFAAQRQDLTRELHDVVAHELTRIAMRATLAQHALTNDEAITAFGEIADSARGALGEMRRLVSIIGESSPTQRRHTPLPVPEIGVEERIVDTKNYLEEVGFHVEVVQNLEDEVIGSRLHAASAIFREASTNIAKHGAPGSLCRIDVSAKDGCFHIEMQNLVAAPAVDDRMLTSGLGLNLLRARVEALGGNLKTCCVNNVWKLSATWEH